MQNSVDQEKSGWFGPVEVQPGGLGTSKCGVVGRCSTVVIGRPNQICKDFAVTMMTMGGSRPQANQRSIYLLDWVTPTTAIRFRLDNQFK